MPTSESDRFMIRCPSLTELETIQRIIDDSTITTTRKTL